ncbi:MAG: hypothetical protein ACYC9J_14645 [Sulfuricaulis sp.]
MSAPISGLSCEDILQREDMSYWLKHALKTAMQRDPVDAVNDADLLAEVLRRRTDAILRGDLSQAG